MSKSKFKKCKRITSSKVKIKNCLILDEDYIDFNSVKDSYKSIIKVKKIKYFLKKRKQEKYLLDS